MERFTWQSGVGGKGGSNRKSWVLIMMSLLRFLQSCWTCLLKRDNYFIMWEKVKNNLNQSLSGIHLRPTRPCNHANNSKHCTTLCTNAIHNIKLALAGALLPCNYLILDIGTTNYEDPQEGGPVRYPSISMLSSETNEEPGGPVTCSMTKSHQVVDAYWELKQCVRTLKYIHCTAPWKLTVFWDVFLSFAFSDYSTE
jgi:hypothetical protein